jgi:hypothetical protein
MVWIYDSTGSLFVSILMHASLTASTLFILSPSAEGGTLMTYYLVLAAALWVVVVALTVVNREQLSGQLASSTSVKNEASFNSSI